MQPDVLGLEAFTQYIQTALSAAAPVAIVGLFVILAIYGVLRPR